MKIRIDSKIKRGMALKMCDFMLDIIKLMFGGIIITGLVGLVDDVGAMVWTGALFIILFLPIALFLYVLGNQRKL